MSVTISEAEYADLNAASAKLEALEAAGVDNWQGYDYAMEILSADRESNDDNEVYT